MQIRNKKLKNVVILSLACFSAVILIELVPRYYSITNLAYQMIAQRFEINSNKNNDAIISELTSKNKSLQKQVNFIVSNYKKSKNISDILELIDSAAQITKITVREIKPGKILKSNDLWLQPVELNISSKYENFFNYILMLEKSSKVMVIKKLNMQQKELSSGAIDINMQLEIYLNI